MIVRTYGRRSRSTDRSSSGTVLAGEDGGATPTGEVADFESSQDPFPFAAFSSQDSSSWSLDPDLPPPISFKPSKPPRKSRIPKRGIGGGSGIKNPKAGIPAAVPPTTATLMEAQEFGEMMEHVDEVNFALDGLRPGQPARIRRASLLSLLSICGISQQRRLLRAQGMAKRIIDSILGLSFDDSPSMVAAAALFYVLASDVQNDHPLDSPSCIRFLLKLLNPPPDTVEDKVPTIGFKLLGIRKHHEVGAAKKEISCSSRAIISKVQEILLSCKEIKSGNEDDEEMGRPELKSKWIALLTMEKACLSTVSIEDTSDMVRRARGNFKERLREFGGLDAIFDVVSSCHSTMVDWFKNNTPSLSDLKNGTASESVVLLLKCLKIMENATFLSKDNQDHLLRMKGKLDSEGLPLSFVGVVISSIKKISALFYQRNSSCISNNEKSNVLSRSVDTYTSSEVYMDKNQIGNQNETSSSQNGGSYDAEMDPSPMLTKRCHKRQKLSASQSEIPGSGLGMSIAPGTDFCPRNKSADCFPSVSCNGTVSGSNRESRINGRGLKMSISSNGMKTNSVRGSNGWITVKFNASKPNSCYQSKRCISEDSYDPFAFDEAELEPSTWELATKTETSHTHQNTVDDGEILGGCDQPIIIVDKELTQLTNEENSQSCENPSPSQVGGSDLMEDCLLTAIKVLMNLTNDNPMGCQQIAAYGGLDTMTSLIIQHFPELDLCFPMHSQCREDTSASNRTKNDGRPGNKHLNDHELDFLVSILGLLVNLVEKDSQNRSLLASSHVSVDQQGRSKSKENQRDVVTLLCSIFLANQGAGEVAGEGRLLLCDDEASLLQGEREAEMMIIEAYAALLLAFLSTESSKVRKAIASCLPNHNLQALVPVLERFVAFHMTLNMISPETHSAVLEVIESCKEP